ncbi:MAG: translesion DNA synthesis-associated protein ImuA [Gammaproteobacteria bacterium]|nr:translesion DNA synthesis-associated protein ImuA [Gammaproteobacteria bacterium]
MSPELQQLLHNAPTPWRTSSAKTNNINGIPTGYPSLDTILPGKGWPPNTLVEMVTPKWGIGELQLLLPLMKQISQQKRWILWVSPPYMPYAPALASAGVDINHVMIVQPEASCKDTLWTIEKTLQTKSCALVLTWLNWLPNGVIRRLQLAATRGSTLGVLFRERNIKNSPAALRLKLQPKINGINVQILKARGTYQHQSVQLNLH